MTLSDKLIKQLHNLRQQGMKMAEINPIAALADEISDGLSKGEISTSDLHLMLDDMSSSLWHAMSERLVTQTNANDQQSIENISELLAGRDCTKMIYRAVFTAHPVFALTNQSSQNLCADAEHYSDKQKHNPVPNDAFDIRETVTLADEHEEAMSAICRARDAITKVNDQIITYNQKIDSKMWRLHLPNMMGVATWVGYDLDGRTDITWSQSIALRLIEKRQALQRYHDALSLITFEEQKNICQRLISEMANCEVTYEKFKALDNSNNEIAEAANLLTDRDAKMISPFALSEEIHAIAKSHSDDKIARALMLVASDIKAHGFGMGEIHLRINAVQLRNAMRSVDGRLTSSSDSSISNRQLLDRLAKRIKTEEHWDINFLTLDRETATARRQLMLAAQILKHIDCDMPIRLLIAECEKPITYMTALYLAHKFNIADKLDISPLFETSFGLEHGVQMMKQLLSFASVQAYVRNRGRLAIQAGFSDAGRFMGQIAANLAIERLQIKLTTLCHSMFGSDVELLMFNTHGESLGRGCARSTISARQKFIFTPFARHHAANTTVPIHHQSSFQGGDGYRLFGTGKLAEATITSLFKAELATPTQEERDDPFYQNRDFSLDLFLSLKNWHETLFKEPQYGQLLDTFGPRLLPKTGSRPAKRKLQAGAERLDPSKIRAIPHNAILQQLGFLAVVISGMGTAAHNDIERFVEIHDKSPRLKQAISHITEAKQLGSLNTVLGYGRLMDNGFWIDKAYHGLQPSNQRAFRQIANFLRDGTSATAIRQTVWRLREDLIDLYRLTSQLGTGSARTTGDDRSDLDILHATRIALIIDTIVRAFQVPRFSESNRFSQSDLYNAALTLNFALIDEIVTQEFPEDARSKTDMQLKETETYTQNAQLSYGDMTSKIREPIAHNQKLIMKITQLISAKYGAHG